MEHPRPQDILDGTVGTRIPRKAGKYHTLFEFMRRHPRMYLYLLVNFDDRLAAYYVGNMATHADLLRRYQANPQAKLFSPYRLTAEEHQESMNAQ